jgi:signal transduction histidine kinase
MDNPVPAALRLLRAPRRLGQRWDLRLPRRTVRLRLTALYGLLFLASGALLLVILNVAAHGWSNEDTRSLPPVGFGPPPRGWRPNAPPDSRAFQHALQEWQKAAQERFAAARAAQLNWLMEESAFALAGMALLSVGAGWIMAGRALRPLREMTAAAQAISADDLSGRLAVTGPSDEMKDLGDTIDSLLARLEAAFDAQRRFVANASHELRTPLAMMRTSVEVAAAKPGQAPPQVTELVSKVTEGLDQADRLLENFLTLARAQYGAKESQETVSLGAVAARMLGEHSGEIAAKAIRAQQEDGGAQVTGNATLLARMAGNLISNAIRHNDRGGWLRIQTRAGQATVHLTVENGGGMLDPASVKQLAQPFRRLAGDRTGSAHGTGLGLSIVAAIAAAHNGSLRLHARPQGGLRAVVELPRALADSEPAAEPQATVTAPAGPAALPTSASSASAARAGARE